MNTENLNIFRDCFELAKTLMQYHQNIPKFVRYSEYSQALSLSCQAMDYIYEANGDKDMRFESLTNLLKCVGGIRSRVRLFGETKCLSPRQSVNLMKLIDSISKQAIGWRKSLQRQSHRANGEMREHSVCEG